MNNIKTRFQIFLNGKNKPSATYYSHRDLLLAFQEDLKIKSELTIEGVNYSVIDVKLSIEDNDIANPNIGFENALVGIRLPYNFEVQVHLQEI